MADKLSPAAVAALAANAPKPMISYARPGRTMPFPGPLPTEAEEQLAAMAKGPIPTAPSPVQMPKIGGK